jgi:uncharacterized protein
LAPTLTRALVARHAGSHRGYGVALLDIAQDHLLSHLASAGLFDEPGLVFKGGTSLRKCRLGTAGRFSTDLDFAAPDEDRVLAVCESIDGAAIAGFRFRLEATRGDGRHWRLLVNHESLGAPNVTASAEFARRPLILAPELLRFVESPTHRAYRIALPTLPVIAAAEACAEKLARYRRIPLARDLYDLSQFAGRPINEALVRRLWVLKVWADVLDDGRGTPPLSPADVLTARHERDFDPESIGTLTQPIDIAGWERRVRQRFGFLIDLDPDEAKWAAVDPRHRGEIEQAIRDLAHPDHQ